MSSPNAPDGWEEPLSEPLLYPDTFYGAPRALMLCIYLCAMVLAVLFAINGKLLATAASVVGALVVHVMFAIATRLEPFWIELLFEWFGAPKDEIEP